MALRPPIAGLTSVAGPQAGSRLNAPAAERNTAAITGVLRRFAPPRGGRALELASGTGQHAVALARALPGLTWQPTELDQARLASIAAWRAAEGPDNLNAPLSLDACVPGWARDHHGQDLVLLINLLHLISTPEARVVISEATNALSPGGRFVLYGPFLRDGRATSDGDRQFHAKLQAQDPEIGYKNDADIRNWFEDDGLRICGCIEMPANNLCFIGEREPG